MKKIVSMILSLMMICLSVIVFADETSATDNITVTMNGEVIEFDVEPILENDRVLVPFRAIFEALGCNVTYTEANGKQFVTAMRGDNQLIIEIGAYDMCVNGNVEALDVPVIENPEENGYISQLNDEYKAYAQKFVQEAEANVEDAMFMLEAMDSELSASFRAV